MSINHVLLVERINDRQTIGNRPDKKRCFPFLKIKADHAPTSNISTDSESTCTSYEDRPPQSNDSGGSDMTGK